MGFNLFPFSNFHDLNLDWIINKIYEIPDKIQSAVDELTKDKLSDENISRIVGSSIYRKGTVILLSDSYGTQSTNWIQIVKNKLGELYSNIISNAKEGAGFRQADNNPTTLLNGLLSGMSDDEKNDVTLVVLCMGANDIGYAGRVADGMSRFCNTVRSNLKNAEIMVGAVGAICFNNRTGNWASKTNANMVDMIDQYMKSAQSNGAYFMPYSFCTMRCSEYFNSDGVHPNADGANSIANMVIANILGTYSTENNVKNEDINLDSDTSVFRYEEGISSGGMHLYVTILNGLTFLSCNNSMFNFETPITGALRNKDVKLGTLSLPSIYGNNGVNFPCLTAPGYLSDGSARIPATMQLYVKNNELHLFFERPDYTPKTGISAAVFFGNLKGTCPTLNN